MQRSALKSYLQMLDPIHNHSFKLCLGALRTFHVENVYVDAQKPSKDDRCGNLFSAECFRDYICTKIANT